MVYDVNYRPNVCQQAKFSCTYTPRGKVFHWLLTTTFTANQTLAHNSADGSLNRLPPVEHNPHPAFRTPSARPSRLQVSAAIGTRPTMSWVAYFKGTNPVGTQSPYSSACHELIDLIKSAVTPASRGIWRQRQDRGRNFETEPRPSQKP